MITIDQMSEYLKAKATADGFYITRGAPVNQDAVVFYLIAPGSKVTAAFSVSGLEQLQNRTLNAMESLLNEKFSSAVKMLKRAA